MTAGNALIIGKDLSNGFTREITTPWPTHRRRPLRTDPWPLICRKSTDVQFLFNDALNIPCNAILEASINVDAVYYYIAARMLSFYRLCVSRRVRRCTKISAILVFGAFSFFEKRILFTFDSKSCNEDYEGTFFLTSRTSMLILSVDYDSSNDLLSDIEFHFVESCLNILFSVLLLIIPHA